LDTCNNPANKLGNDKHISILEVSKEENAKIKKKKLKVQMKKESDINKLPDEQLKNFSK